MKGLLKSDRKKDIWIAIGLFAVTFLSRVPFRSQFLYHWDSVNFANALREFDVIQEHPQPPGYIVYVWLARVVDWAFNDAQVTMVWISIVASALAVVALFLLGRAMWDRRVGVVAALLLASSPLFWFYGEIALPHPVDTFLVILSGWWLYEVMCGRTRFLLPAAAVLGIAGGVRQQTLVFLVPVTLFAVRRAGLKALVMAAGLGAVICVVWFVPLTSSAGGVGPYMDKLSDFAANYQKSTSVLMGAGLSGIAYNVRKLGMYTLFGLAVALIPLVAFVSVKLWRGERSWSWQRFWFLVLWIGPALAFYTFIHMGQQGLIFVFLPGLLLLSAVGLVWLFDAEIAGKWLPAAVGAVVLANVSIFCLAPEYPLGSRSQRILTRATLTNSDRYIQDRLTAIRENFLPQNTIVMSASPEHVAYYLPEYVKVPFQVHTVRETGPADRSVDARLDSVVVPQDVGLEVDGEKQILVVMFDAELAALNQSQVPLRELFLQHNDVLLYFPMTEHQVLRYGPAAFRVAAN